MTDSECRCPRCPSLNSLTLCVLKKKKASFSYCHTSRKPSEVHLSLLPSGDGDQMIHSYWQPGCHHSSVQGSFSLTQTHKAFSSLQFGKENVPRNRQLRSTLGGLDLHAGRVWRVGSCSRTPNLPEARTPEFAAFRKPICLPLFSVLAHLD